MKNHFWYLKIGNELVNFDPDSGGYPYKGEDIVPKYFLTREDAQEMLRSMIDMKLLPEHTRICSVVL